MGSAFLPLQPFYERPDPSLRDDAIAARLRERFRRDVPEARVNVFGAPPVDGLGMAGGFKLMVETTGDVNFDALQAQADAAGRPRQPTARSRRAVLRLPRPAPQLYVDVDRTKVKTVGVQLTDVFDLLQAYLGSYYVNDFNRFGRTWQVNVQAEDRFRTDPEMVKQLRVRNADGDMVPLGAVAEVRDSTGPFQIVRYNMFPATAVNGSPRCRESAPAMPWRPWKSWPRTCRAT